MWRAADDPERASFPGAVPGPGRAGRLDLSARSTAALAVLCVAAMAWRLISEPFDHGYVRYAGTALDMVLSGDWIVPRIHDAPYLLKPPLYLWLIALPTAWVGHAPGWVQQVPNAIAWIGGLAGSYVFARRWLGSRAAGLAAAGVLATSYEFFVLVRGKRIDPLLTAALTGALVCWFLSLESGVTRVRRLFAALASYTLLSVAILVKGPVAFVCFASVALAFSFWQGRWRALCTRSHGLGLCWCLALVSIWPALLVARLGITETLDILRATPLVTRYANPFHYLLKFAVLFLPWSVFLPALVVWLRRARPDRDSEALRFLLCWIGGVFLPLELSPAKHSRYLLPVYPAMSVCIVALWMHPSVTRMRTASRWGSALRSGALALLFAAILGFAFAAPFAAGFTISGHCARAVVAATAAGLLLGAAALQSLTSWRKGADPRSLFLRAILLIGVTGALYDAGHAVSFREADHRDEAQTLLAPIRSGAPARSFALDEIPRTVVLLATERHLAQSETPAQVANWLRGRSGKPAFVITDGAGAHELAGRPELGLRPAGAVKLAGGPIVLLSTLESRETQRADGP